jgi:hypothetical protein
MGPTKKRGAFICWVRILSDNICRSNIDDKKPPGAIFLTACAENPFSGKCCEVLTLNTSLKHGDRAA